MASHLQHTCYYVFLNREKHNITCLRLHVYLRNRHASCMIRVLDVTSCVVLTFEFACKCGFSQHLIWTRSIFALILCDVCNCRRDSCWGVIVRLLCFDRMICVQITHAVWVPGMQMKRKEPHFKFEGGHQNDLEHTYTWCHACWYVLDVLIISSLWLAASSESI